MTCSDWTRDQRVRRFKLNVFIAFRCDNRPTIRDFNGIAHYTERSLSSRLQDSAALLLVFAAKLVFDQTS